MTKYITVSDVVSMAGMSLHHASRTIRDFGIDPVKKMMPVLIRNKSHNRLKLVITEKEAKRFLKSRNLGVTKINKKPKPLLEDILAKRREKEGWYVIPTYKAGIPDLILLKRIKGKLEIKFEDAKSSQHGVSKEQYIFKKKLADLGVEVEFTWL